MEYFAESGPSHPHFKAIERTQYVGRHLATDKLKIIQEIKAALNYPIQCLQPENALIQELISCRQCLSRWYETPAIAFYKYRKHIIHVFADLNKRTTNLKICSLECGGIKVLNIAVSECHLRVVDHFVTFRLAGMLLVPPYNPYTKMLTVLNLKLGSGCIWAQYTPETLQCLTCLRGIGALAVHKLSLYTALISIHPSERSKEEVQALEIAHCVAFYKCFQVSFVPNAMCMYEMTMTNGATAGQQKVFLTKYHSSLHKPTSLMVGTQLNVRNTFSFTLSSSSAPLVDTRGSSQDKLASTDVTHHSYSASKLWPGLDSGQTFVGTNVLVVSWSKNSFSCVKCLALFAERILIQVF